MGVRYYRSQGLYEDLYPVVRGLQQRVGTPGTELSYPVWGKKALTLAGLTGAVGQNITLEFHKISLLRPDVAWEEAAA